MSYSTGFYAVVLKDVISSFGSKDARRLAIIVKEEKQRLKSSDKWFASEISEGAPTLKQALADLFDGKANQDYAWQNWYACELVVKNLGDRLDSGDEVSSISDLNFDTPLAKPRLFLPLGEPLDFPEVSYLHAEEIENTLKRASRHTPPASSSDQWEPFCRCLNAARKKGRDLVTFNY